MESYKSSWGGMIIRRTYRVFEVESESKPGIFYTVWFDPLRDEWMCNCIGNYTRPTQGKKCKHVAEILELVGEVIKI